MKAILCSALFFALPAMAANNFSCELTRKDGDSMVIHTVEVFGGSVTETATTYNFKAIDFEESVGILTEMTIDKTTLKGRITVQRGSDKAFTAKADCNH